ncbi:hypothetical protein [Paraburkholderia sp. DHOC27]|uniref:hypothetical protein n=1 Tax=Paraburkholderia sp. DHOC27 TaxID=2303330 RepID=UPI000E3E4CDE|nr:hypothetical protein [Paraburkholderia sp. DHOC27]RFU46978.1 hypothetical protein D0B32_12455 [Paraburkholderia sp. DHOC27]
MKMDGWQIPIAVLAGVMCASAYLHHPEAAPDVVAAWVQGVGSLVAIGAAVWIYAKQYQDKKVDDESETIAFVQAMRVEIQVIWEEYQGIRAALLATPANGFYSSVVPLSTDSLIVYSRTPERVGKIDDEALRALVVRMYTGLRGHLNSLRQNNALVDDYERFYTTPMDGDWLGVQQRKQSIMQDYTARLKIADGELKKLVEKFLSDTEAWLRRQQKQAA